MIALLLLVQDVTYYRVDRLIPIAGYEIENAWFAVEKGKIKAFGGLDTFAPEEGAPVFLGGVCMPGIVDAGTPTNAVPNGNEESSEVTPAVRALRLFDPSATDVQRLRQQGVTTYFIAPGSRNVVGGLASVIKLNGRTAETMAIREDVTLAAAMGRDPSSGNWAPRGFGTPGMYSRRPTTRMGVVYEFRRAFLQANEAREAPSKADDPGTAVLIRALERKLPVRIVARRATDIETAIRLAREFSLSIQIEGAQEAGEFVETIKTQKIPVIFHPHVRVDRIGGPEGTEPRLDTFMKLADGTAPVALVGQGVEEGEGPLAMGTFLSRFGAKREAILKALTLWPAQILGVGDRVGTIEAGRDADLLFLSGDPLQATTRIEAVMIDGKVIEGKVTK